MRTHQLFLATALLLGISLSLKAADLCVVGSGGGGCYSTISAALAAASNGDRILIQPQVGVPYVENLVIDKSVELLSNQEGVKWELTGNILITPAAGRTIGIMHMKNLGGNIYTDQNSPIGTRCTVNIVDCELVTGNINFNYDNFNVRVISSIISNGYVVFRFGSLIGNQIQTSTVSSYYSGGEYATVWINTDSYASNDTIFIVGNKITSRNNGYYYDHVLASNTYAHFLYVTNNYLVNNGHSGYYYHSGIRIYYGKNSSTGGNVIMNNTIKYINASYYQRGILLYSLYANASFAVINNLILSPVNNTSYSSNGIYVDNSTGPVGASYNFMSPGLTMQGIVNNGTNNLNSNTTLDSDGRPQTGSDAINGGAPDYSMYDIDLTRNDVGAYGGSFTLDNFFPVTGAARVFFVRAPRVVLQGGLFNIKAEAFDR